jgi:RHS repeat-associated protein
MAVGICTPAGEWDVETGLQYNRARYYDPTTSRWISQDPLGFDAGDSNLYRYVRNAPTTLSDAAGLYVNTETLNDLSGVAKKGWKQLEAAPFIWRLKVQGKFTGATFTAPPKLSISLDVTDAVAIDLLTKGHDIQWESGKWLVDFGINSRSNGRIWIDSSQSDKEAAGQFNSIIPRLIAGLGKGFNIDLYPSVPNQTLVTSLSNNPIVRDEALAGKLSPREARLILNLSYLKGKGQTGSISALVNFVVQNFKSPTKVPVLETIKLFLAGKDAKQIDDLIAKLRKNG